MFDTDSKDLTYEILNYIDLVDYEAEYIFGDDTIFFVKGSILLNQNGKNLQFQKELITFLSRISKLSVVAVKKKLWEKLVYLSEKGNAPIKFLNLNIIEKEYSLRKITEFIFVKETIYSVFARNINAKFIFHNCNLSHVQIEIQELTPENFSFQNCRIGFLRQQSTAKNQIVSLENCSIDLLELTAEHVALKNISNLLFAVFLSNKVENLDIDNVAFIFSREKVLNYQFFPSRTDILFSTPLREKESKLIEFLKFYMLSPVEIAQGVTFDLTEKQIGVMTKLKFYIRRLVPKLSPPTYAKKIGEYEYTEFDSFRMDGGSLGLAKNQSVIIRSLGILYDNIRNIKARQTIRKYFHYFGSRNNIFRKILFIIHEGYSLVCRPILFLLFSVMINIYLISFLNISDQNLSSIYYNINAVKYFENILFYKLEFNSLLIIRLFSLFLEAINLYLIFCISIYIKEIISFPKKYE